MGGRSLNYLSSRQKVPGQLFLTRLGLLVVFFSGLAATSAEPLDSWFRRSPAPTGAHLVGVAFGNGLYVAAGYNSVVTSPDGTNWTWFAYDYSIAGRLSYGFGYAAGTFVIVGAGGWIATSSNGTNWTTQSSGGGPLWDVAYGQGRYVAVGDLFKTSLDGISWTNAPSPNRLLSITYGNNQFITVGFDGIWGSTDGVNWSQRFSKPYLILYDVSYGDGRYVAVGYDQNQVGTPPVAYYSLDGFIWQSAGTLQNYSGVTVTYGQGKFLSSGSGGSFMTSTNGAAWANPGAALAMSVEALHYANGNFLAVGGGGKIAVSPNGTNWQEFNFSAAPTLQSVASLKNKWVAVGDGGSMVGSDGGTNWYPLSAGITNSLFAVTSSSNLFVAVGGNGRIVSSPDRTNWVSQISPTVQSLAGVSLCDSQFVAVGNAGTLLTSTDGTNWLARTSNTTQPLKDVACRAGLSVAVGYGGTIVTSTNGTNWTSATISVLNDLESVTCGVGKFVAVGGSGRGPGIIALSTNGTNWTLVGQNVSSSVTRLAHVTYAQGQFVSVSGANVFTSTDGTTWQPRATTIQAGLQAVAFGANHFVAIGGSGQIYQSASVGSRLAVKMNPGGKPVMTIFGHAGASYQIQASTNLLNWEILASGIQTSSESEWEDLEALPSRSYRVLFQ